MTFRAGVLVVPVVSLVLAGVWIIPSPAHAARVASGTYTGNGADNRSITGVGFQPDVVVIQGDGELNGVFRTSTMTGDTSAPVSGTAYTADAIQALDADGFQIGTSTSVNQNSTTYTWFALQTSGNEGAAVQYIGNGSDDRSITGLGFQPELVILKGNTAQKAYHRPSSLSGDAALPLAGGASAANILQALDADGFQVGSGSEANANGTTYDAIGWNTISGAFAVGSYTGNDADNRSITGVGFQPDVVIMKQDGAQAGVFRTSAHTGDSTSAFDSANASNLIQGFETDGFQVGTAQKVNDNGKTHHWAAWKHAPPPDPPTVTPSGGTYTSTQTVSLAAASGTTISYTLDGTTPTAASSAYSTALTISTTTTVKAIAVDGTGKQSTVLTATFTISGSDTGDTSGTASTATSGGLGNATVSLEQGTVDDDQRIIHVPRGKPVRVTSRPPDPDQVKGVVLKVEGKTLRLKKADSTRYEALVGPFSEPGTYPFVLVADYGTTTRAERGIFQVKGTETTRELPNEGSPAPAPSTSLAETTTPGAAELPELISGPSIPAPTASPTVPPSGTLPAVASPPPFEGAPPEVPSSITISGDRVAGVFLANLVRVSEAQEPLHSSAPVTDTLRWIDTLLVVVLATSVFLFVSTAAYIIHLGTRHTTFWHACRFAVVGPRQDLNDHFSRHVPRHQETGEILVPFSTWKSLAVIEARCLVIVPTLAAGKVAVAALATLLILRSSGL